MGGVICNTNDRRKNQGLKNENEKNNDLNDEKNDQINEIESSTTKNTPNNNIPNNDSNKDNNPSSPNKIKLDTNLLVTKGINNIKNNYKRTKILGQGSFGTVYLVKHKILNNFFAMKEIKKANKSDIINV